MAAEETRISKEIMLALSGTCALFRSPAGMYWQGRLEGKKLTNLRAVRVLVEGWPDLTGWRRSDGRMVLIEVKTPRGRVSHEQQRLIDLARSHGVLAGVARSVEDARRIVEDDNEEIM